MDEIVCVSQLALVVKICLGFVIGVVATLLGVKFYV